jgi:hypothetical protein
VVIATLIGDIVGSRRHAAPAVLHRRLRVALQRTNDVLEPSQALDVTVGDEFQGGFASVAEAVRASLLIRLLLLADEDGADSRYGLGWGEVTVFEADRSPLLQDGPGWWAARAAIDRAAGLGRSPRTSFVRTCFGSSPQGGDAARFDASIEAFLLCRDASVGHMTNRQRRLLLGVMLGHSQAELARMEGITQSAVSQTLARSGATAIELSQRRLEAGEPQ